MNEKGLKRPFTKLLAIGRGKLAIKAIFMKLKKRNLSHLDDFCEKNCLVN